jgi:hypothetical protein
VTDTILIEVLPFPWVALNLPFDSICINSGAQILSGGIPVGGTYYGPGVSGDTLYLQQAGTGNHIVNYQYNDPVSGCIGWDTTIIYVDLCLGVQSEKDYSQILHYPNPTDGILTISIPFALSPCELLIVDPLGRTLINRKTSQQETDRPVVINLAGYSPGLYFLRIRGEGFIITKQVILK